MHLQIGQHVPCYHTGDFHIVILPRGYMVLLKSMWEEDDILRCRRRSADRIDN